jgi:hypothetical protein
MGLTKADTKAEQLAQGQREQQTIAQRHALHFDQPA